jgi:hypothetical protein
LWITFKRDGKRAFFDEKNGTFGHHFIFRKSGNAIRLDMLLLPLFSKTRMEQMIF